MNILIYPLFSTLSYGVILSAKVLMAIFVVVFHVLERVDGGLATLCIGGGQGIATIFERA